MTLTYFIALLVALYTGYWIGYTVAKNRYSKLAHSMLDSIDELFSDLAKQAKREANKKKETKK